MIISRTPLRISFAGGGTDLPSYYKSGAGPGAVLSSAIDKYIYITVNKKFDDQIRISYSETEIAQSVDEIKHNIIREALKLVGVENGIEVVYMGDIPLGSAGIGLGSSSSLAVGVLNALYAYVGVHASAEKLARQACHIEIDILGHPIGKQDQYIAAYGGINYTQFNQDESVFVDPVIFRAEAKTALNRKLMLFYTGIERISSTILKEQNESIEETMEDHHKIAGLASEARERFRENDISALGDLLYKGWKYKTRLASGVTNSKINEWYQRAIDAGSTGGKIVGAGGGGFLLMYCDEEKQDRVRRALGELKESPFKFEAQGSKIIYVSD